MNTTFSYAGRINRLKYFAYSVGVTLLSGLVMGLLHAAPSFIRVVFYLAALVVSSFFAVQRLHDINRPGWHYWLLAIPLYNIYLYLVLLFKRGDAGANQYGTDPLAPAITPAA